METKAVGAVAADAPVASELTVLMDELRAAVRAAGEDFPPLVHGATYGLTEGNFVVPADKAAQRARDYGIKQPRDFVLGELGVNLERTRLGYKRTDNRVRQNAGLRLLVELVETVHAARAVSERYAGLAGPVQAYVTAIWSAMAEQTKATGAPESVRTFLLTCVSRGLGGAKAPAAKADDHVAKVTEAAAELFMELTSPPAREEQQRLDGARDETDMRAAKRVDRVCSELLPYFGELIMLAMPQQQAAVAKDAPKKLVSAEEARAKNQERRAALNASANNAETAKADCERVLSGIKHHDLSRNWPNPDAPTSADIRATIETLIERGTIKRPNDIDKLIGLVLRGARTAALKRPSFSVKAKGPKEAPWSLTYMKQLSGPDFTEILKSSVADVGSRELDEPRRPGGLGRLFDDRSKSNEARDWVSANASRIEGLKGMSKVAGELRRHDGVTAQIAQRLVDLQRDIMDAFEECRRVSEVLAKNYEFKSARHFAEMRARIETLFAKHDMTIGTLRSVAGETGTFKRLLRATVGGQDGLSIDGLMNGIDRILEAQAPARAYLAKIADRYPEATASLMTVLAPRLDWFDTAVTKTQTSRQSDPLLAIFDGAWIGTVTAELRRAELAATRICNFVDGLPDHVREQVMVEVESEESLKEAMVCSVARRLAERLAGRPADAPITSFDIAAVQSRLLPALAARPRLSYLCAAQGVLDAGMNDIVEIDRFAATALRDGNQPAYSIESEQREERDEAIAARGEYNFWCRTFDLDAPSRSFMSELLGWGTYHAPALRDAIARSEAAEGEDEAGRALGEVAQIGAGTHPIADISGRELGDRLTQIDTISRRLATSLQALNDLKPLLDASIQPVAVLVHAASTVTRAKDKDAAVELLTPWLRLPDARLREAARKAIAELRGQSVPELLAEHLASQSDRLIQLLAMHDTANLADAVWAVEPLELATKVDDGVVRCFAAHALASVAANAKDTSANAAGTALVRLLGDDDIHVVDLACEGLRALAEKGNAYTTKLVIDSVMRNQPHPYVAGLLEQIGESPVLIEALKIEARGAHARMVAQDVAAAHEPRARISQQLRNLKLKAVHTGQQELSDVALSAARAAGGPANLEALSDRMKLALRLVSKFEHWTTTLRPELRPQLETIDFADGIVDDAVAELAGKPVRGYLSGSPELVSELFSAPGFSAAEISILEGGRIPDTLVELASHPMALDGSWRDADITKAFDDPTRFKALVQLKLALSYDLPGVVGDVIASVLDESTPSAIAAIAYDSLVSVLGCEIPLLDPSLDAAARKKAMADAKPLDPAIDALVERAVVDRLAIVDPTSDEAKVLVEYLASGKPHVAERRLSDALDRSTSEPQAQLILDAARIRARGRRAQSSAKNQETIPWLISVLGAAPRATIAQVIAVRDARQATIEASEPGSVARAGERVATLATAVLDVRENMPAAELSPLLAILADSEDDGARLSKIDGLRELMRNTKIPWTPERVEALRNALLVVQANQRYGDMARTLEHAIGFAGRVLAASVKLPDEDMGKLFEILARCNDMSARTSYADAVVKMYRLLESRGDTLSTVFIEQLGLWLGAADSSRSGSFVDADRKRETILNGVAEILPLSDEAMTTLVASCAGLTAQRTGEVLRICKDHLRSAELTAKDVEAIVAKGASAEETSSLFKSILGVAVSLTAWKPSTTFSDPLEQRWNDSREVENAKRELRRSMGNLFDTLAAPRGESAPVTPLVISDKIGTFSLGAWSRGETAARDADPATAAAYQAGDASKLLSSSDYAAHLAAANKLADAARDRFLDGKHPVEQIYALQLNNSRAIADAFDSLFSKSHDSSWELSHRGSRIHASNFVKAMVQRTAAQRAADEAERLGLPPPPGFVSPPVFLKGVDEAVEERTLDVFVGLVIDNSDSTKIENRLAYFKQLAVMMTAAFGMTKNIRIHCAVTKFSDYGQMIMAPAVKHDVKTMVQAFGPLGPESSTNAVDGLAKSRLASNQRKFDLAIHIVCTDGRPNDVPSTIATIDLLRQDKHVVIGLGVGPDASFLETVFGKNHYIPESDPSRLAPRLYHYLKDQVLSELAG